MKKYLSVGLVSMFALFGLVFVNVSQVFAQNEPTLTAVTLNGLPTVIVAPNTTITATVTGTGHDNGTGHRWSSTKWGISASSSVSVCVDTPDVGTGGATNSFSIMAPAIDGTYNANFIGYIDDSCSSEPSSVFTLSNAVVVFTDITPPVIETHLNVTAEATSGTGAVVAYTSPATSDNLDAPGIATCLPASGTTFALGTTPVTCNAVDSAGNHATSTTFNITVQDTTAPVIIVPSSVITEAGIGGTTVVNYDVATASDLVDGVVVATCLPQSGSTFPTGTTTVTCSATDAHSNTGAASFTVTVNDNMGPVLILPNPIVEATSASGATVEYTATANDVVDGSVSINCTPVSGSIFPLGVTTVNCSATDSASNTNNDSFTVTVQDTTLPVIVLTGSANITIEVNSAAYVDAGAIAHDNYDANVPVTTSDTVDVTILGDYTLHYNHTDTNGNIAVEVIRVVHVVPHDVVPDQFIFIDQTDVALNTIIESNTITVNGISTGIPISITGGEYSINDGTYTSVDGTVVNGDTVKVRQTSSTLNSTSVDTVLTIDSISETFTSTTIAAPRRSGGGSFIRPLIGQVLGVSTGPIPGCGNRTTGFSVATGLSCVGNTGIEEGPIPGCGNRTTGFSVVTGQSCVGNAGTVGQVLGQVLGAGKHIFAFLSKEGSTGDEIEELQKFLNEAGYFLAIDGKFGKKTKEAVVKFQIVNGLKGDGIVGPLTRIVLNR